MNNLLGPETGYVDLFLYQLQESLIKENENGNKYQRTPIRPSSAGKCARELYFELMQYSGRAKFPTKPMEPEISLLLNLGHHIERHILENLRRHFTLAEVKYCQQVLHFDTIVAENDPKLTQHLEGSMDLCFWSEKWKCVADVKSKGDNYDYRKRQMKWESDTQKLLQMSSVQTLSDRAFWVNNLDDFLLELQDPFFEANFKQLNLYANSQFLKDRGIDHGAIIQYHKSKSKLREIRFRPSTTVYNATVDKFRNVIKAVDEAKPELAPMEYPPDSFKTRYCDFCVAKTPGSCVMLGKKPK